MSIKYWYFLLPTLIISSNIFIDVAYATENNTTKIRWSYEGKTGPDYWGELSPNFTTCATGQLQSPINIPNKTTPVANSLLLHYEPTPMNIEKDGNTELYIGHTKTIINDGHTIQLNFPKSKHLESATYNGVLYHLVQFHLHTPSENQIQQHSFPLEIHFVHQNDQGQLLVLGVFVTPGAANSTLQEIIDHLPEKTGKNIAVPHTKINPINLIPSKNDYYSFEGSLTTPPCSEKVRWVVLSEPITASPEQITALKKAIGFNNARPIQPLHDRPILHSVEQ